MKKMYWKKKKTVAMYLNRRQFEEEFGTNIGSDIEIIAENGSLVITETSSDSSPNYIITE